jgi:glycosyltransferase involved in cell wall biosynthesis
MGLAGALAARGHDTEVLALQAAPEGMPTTGADPVPGGIGPGGLWRLHRRCRAADVVVGYGGRTLPVGALVTIGSPFVYRSIGDPDAWITTTGRRLRARMALGRARRVVALWDGAADAFEQSLHVDPARTTVIPSGFDTDIFRPPTGEQRAKARTELDLADGAACLTIVGALSEEKRVERAIDAAALVRNAVLLVVGDGPRRSPLEAHGARHGDVRFLGALTDVRPVLHAADVIISTSQTEGLQGSLIEGALCGIPAVATDVGGTRMVVAPGESGEVVAADAPSEEVAAAIRRVLADRALLGSAARAHATAQFSADHITDRWESLLAEVVDG